MSPSDQSKDPSTGSFSSEMDAAMAEMGKAVDLERAMRRAEGEPPKFIHGKVAGIAGKDVFIELGPKDQGIIPVAEFDGPPRLGEFFDFVVVGKDDELWILSRSEAKELASWKEMEKGKLVSARVTGQNTGGLELKVGPIEAFMPASQVGLTRIDDLSRFIGETLVCEVIEIERRRKRVTLSRRTVMEREARQKRDDALRGLSLVPGNVVTGHVTRIEDFGAFVELMPGVEGLLHVSNISRSHVNHPSERLKVGQKVEVAVLSVEQGGKRIGLGSKQLEPDPWDTITERFRPEDVVTGKVVRAAAFGAFVEIADGIEGLVHVSQLGGARGRPTHEIARVGESWQVRVIQVDPDKKRISLSRLDKNGTVIGTETESADEQDLKTAREETRPSPRGGVNLGDLLRRALGD